MKNLKYIITGMLLAFYSLSYSQITINTPFKVNSNNPIDLRDTLSTLSDTANVDFVYPGLLSYVRDLDEFWRVDSSLNWGALSEKTIYNSDGAISSDREVLLEGTARLDFRRPENIAELEYWGFYLDSDQDDAAFYFENFFDGLFYYGTFDTKTFKTYSSKDGDYGQFMQSEQKFNYAYENLFVQDQGYYNGSTWFAQAFGDQISMMSGPGSSSDRMALVMGRDTSRVHVNDVRPHLPDSLWRYFQIKKSDAAALAPEYRQNYIDIASHDTDPSLSTMTIFGAYQLPKTAPGANQVLSWPTPSTPEFVDLVTQAQVSQIVNDSSLAKNDQFLLNGARRYVNVDPAYQNSYLRMGYFQDPTTDYVAAHDDIFGVGYSLDDGGIAMISNSGAGGYGRIWARTNGSMTLEYRNDQYISGGNGSPGADYHSVNVSSGGVTLKSGVTFNYVSDDEGNVNMEARDSFNLKSPKIDFETGDYVVLGIQDTTVNLYDGSYSLPNATPGANQIMSWPTPTTPEFVTINLDTLNNPPSAHMYEDDGTTLTADGTWNLLTGLESDNLTDFTATDSTLTYNGPTGKLFKITYTGSVTIEFASSGTATFQSRIQQSEIGYPESTCQVQVNASGAETWKMNFSGSVKETLTNGWTYNLGTNSSAGATYTVDYLSFHFDQVGN